LPLRAAAGTCIKKGMNSSQTPPAWHPERLARRRPYLKARAKIQAALRGWFAAQGFVEVETPALQVSPGMEPHLQAFATELKDGAGAGAPRYLHTSPEFAMKKLLAGGERRIFQFARAYRNAECSPTHHPEFTMLEWYRAGDDYTRLMEDCAALLQVAAEAAGADSLRHNGLAVDPRRPIERISVADAFALFAGIDLLATTIANPADPPLEPLAREASRIGIAAHDGDRWEDVFFRIMFERIEPQLAKRGAAILDRYPISMAALSRPCPDDRLVAERFELYVAGLELANAFGELTDAQVQRARFEADMALKQRLYGTRYPIDRDFLAALEHGLPECSGIALGFDRLAMLATGAAQIEDVLWLPVA
jgi:lysyl-tRNA synthetase class 2